ncbi:AAA family ATPase [Schaalia hyovaginalis]|uniref:AAA family ATPase n=1 Tax=Schaalia hyovaginalis TaxID=29316 RepID=UPI00139EB2B6|nr:AAA family ATPase [Schaalia hyovaginalis]MST65140.1 AAA family ATPase [Schaalia hyovaginalis]
MTEPFLITKIQLKHFRSIGSCSLAPGQLAILVGPNGSGKSNVLDSLRLTSQALRENLDNALRERGGISEVRRRSNGHPTHFHISLEFCQGVMNGSYSFEVGAVANGGFVVRREECRIIRGAFDPERHFFEIHNGEVSSSSVSHTPRLVGDRLGLVAFSGLDEFSAVFDGLTGIEVFNLYPDAMRRPQQPDPGDVLRRDGSNVSSVLERLQRQDQKVKKRIESYLSSIVPGVQSVNRKSVGNWESLEFFQKVEGARSAWRFPSSSMSDGTLRALGVLMALFAGSGSRLSPIGIEEPESALHPAASGALLDAIRDATKERQVFLTSHSPDLLDSEDIRPEEIFAVRSQSGNTFVDVPDHAAMSALRNSLFTAGELVRADQMFPQAMLMSQQMLWDGE